MNFLRTLYTNHPLANIGFVLVLLIGGLSYQSMPREQDPEINFNWVNITTVLPGASAEDVERLVTNPLEDGIKGVPDVRFVISTSRENVSTTLVRFRDIDERTFDKRMADLRREIQNKAASELPPQALEPQILESTTSNGFPTASIMVVGQADDETLRINTRRIKSDLERIKGVDQVFASGLRDPEILIQPDPQALAARGVLLSDVADSLSAWWRDTSAGTLKTEGGTWSVGITGISTDPAALGQLPIFSSIRPGQSVRLGDVARIERTRAPASQLASTDGRAAISLALTKKSGINTLTLVGDIRSYIEAQNTSLAPLGLELRLTDDQTVPTSEAIGVMQTNALLGVVLVLAICWLFLGARIGLLVALGLPFSLLGTFAVLSTLDYTVNISVLLGVVIALGMLVDDAVVVVEAIYYRMERGQAALNAALDAVAEVWKPVLASVATTMAAFLPLMLLPGIVGKFMFVIPFVVTLALLISLIEAFWMMPVHVQAIGVRFDRPTKEQRWRTGFNRGIRLRYGQALAYVLRRPKRFAVVGLAAVSLAVTLLVTGTVRVQFFAFDPIRAFYVNVDMPQSATLDATLLETQRVEALVRKHLRGVGPGAEARAATSTAGIKFTDSDIVYGDAYGQVFVSLNPATGDARAVGELVDELRTHVQRMDSPAELSFTVLAGGPPSGKPINVKVRGDRFEDLESATQALKVIVAAIPGTRDVKDDNLPGRSLMQLTMDTEAVRATGLTPGQIARTMRLSVDGEVLAFTRNDGDKIDLRVQSANATGDLVRANAFDLLREPVALANGQTTTLGQLVDAQAQTGRGFIRHHNLRRTITVEADLDKEVTDTAAANAQIKAAWAPIQAQHPNVDLDFSGELEDIEESLAAMKVLFLMGVGLIYLILAAQFKSYFQPVMILVTVPLAFTGVAYGLALSNNPLSLYTLYGVIALTGIAVNAAIVLIDAANSRLQQGMSAIHAIVQAGRRRVVPIVITTTTTIGGLFSLAFGLGGESLLWGPVAASMVWGLAFSTVLTLFAVPLLFMTFMRPKAPRQWPVLSRLWRAR